MPAGKVFWVDVTGATERDGPGGSRSTTGPPAGFFRRNRCILLRKEIPLFVSGGQSTVVQYICMYVSVQSLETLCWTVAVPRTFTVGTSTV